MNMCRNAFFHTTFMTYNKKNIAVRFKANLKSDVRNIMHFLLNVHFGFIDNTGLNSA